MHRASRVEEPGAVSDRPAVVLTTDEIHRRESRNFRALALYQILLRTGWIFKTESIIMPAVLDILSGAGWVRGWLPVLNRFGYSIPPLLMARRIKVMQRKKWSLLSTTIYMSLTFLAMAGIFLLDRDRFGDWLPGIFLALYGIFFIAIGVNQLAFNTLQGKLIQPTRRGRLLLISNALGAVTAIGCAFWLLPHWLSGDQPRFDLVFGFSGMMFAVSGVAILWTVESPDHYQESATSIYRYFHEAGRVVRTDRRFRRLAFVGVMFGSSIMLFPHYQNLALQGLKLDLSNLMWWVVVQNVGTALFSIPAGPLADRFGYRLVLRVGLLVVAAGPLAALALSWTTAPAPTLFNFVFFCIGATPVLLRAFQNYALELSPPHQHPRYLSTIGLVIAAPIVASPVAGWLVDRYGHAVVFLLVATAVLVGWFSTMSLEEPRSDAPKAPV